MAATLEAIETVWTQERVERLEEFWASGMSAALVAHALGPGVTRNAVISKVHRLKLPERLTLSSLAPPASRRGEKIVAMRAERIGTAAIAKALGISQRTVYSALAKFSPPRPNVCAWCSASLESLERDGRRRYCSDECRLNAKRRLWREASRRAYKARRQGLKAGGGPSA
jgi:GcrA cell cycle regulator